MRASSRSSRLGKLSTHLLIFSLLFLTLSIGTVFAQEVSSRSVIIEVNGTIGFPSLDHIRDGLSYAKQINAQSLTILLDTPGGSLDATFEIVKTIELSEIPVITFVYPRGATGWSAGVFILLSSHVAAMSSGTVIGSSQPIDFPSGVPITDPKLINALTEFLVERARIHGRNETAATLFVTENLNLGAEEAQRVGVIDAKAETIEELMNLVDGREVEVFEGKRIQHQTRGAELVRVDQSIRISVLKLISEPTIAYLLFNLGFWIVIFGIMTVGLEGEIIGGILLLIGLIGLGYNVDLLVIVLILAGGVLILAEMAEPGLQIFGPAGIVAFVIGSLLLLRLDPTRWLISQGWYTILLVIVAVTTVTLAGFASFILYKVFRLPKQRITVEWVIGKTGRAVDALGPDREGYAQVEGEYWRAKASTLIEAGQAIIVTGKEGSVLTVESADKKTPSNEA